MHGAGAPVKTGSAPAGLIADGRNCLAPAHAQREHGEKAGADCLRPRDSYAPDRQDCNSGRFSYSFSESGLAKASLLVTGFPWITLRTANSTFFILMV